jgi:hypothetical protein
VKNSRRHYIKAGFFLFSSILFIILILLIYVVIDRKEDSSNKSNYSNDRVNDEPAASYPNTNNVNSEKEIITVTSAEGNYTIESDTSKWEAYNNVEMGLSLKYPKDWEVSYSTEVVPISYTKKTTIETVIVKNKNNSLLKYSQSSNPVHSGAEVACDINDPEAHDITNNRKGCFFLSNPTRKYARYMYSGRWLIAESTDSSYQRFFHLPTKSYIEYQNVSNQTILDLLDQILLTINKY